MTTTTRSQPTDPSRDRAPRRAVRRRRWAIALLALLAVTAVSTFDIARRGLENAAARPPVDGVTEVALRDDRFLPASVAVPTGTTVTFTWDDDGTVHDVVFADGQRSERIADGSYQRTFTEPGEYAYTCSLHAFMDGRVVVEP